MSEDKRIYFLKQLNHPDVETRKEAIENLGREEDPHVFKILSGHFSDNHPVIRDTLYRAFLENKNRRIAEIAADTIYSPQLSVRSLAMRILRSMDDEAIFPLRRLTKSSKPEVRKIAVELLGDIGNSQSADTILELIEDPDETVLSAIIEALGKQKEIRAVPRLFEYYETHPKLKPVILNTLSQIFLWWEKNIIRPDIINADPFFRSSFVSVVQENGNVSALNLILHWLEKDAGEMGDDLLKALKSILQKNIHITLPGRFFKIISETWNNYSEKLQPSTVLDCISRIPTTDAFNLLITQYEKNSQNKIIEQALHDYVKRFFPVFITGYFSLKRKLRLKVMHMLKSRETPIHDSGLLDLYESVKYTDEKKLLLKLAVMSGIPEARKVVLARLSENSTKQPADDLDCLLYYRDEELWHVFKNYITHSDPEVRIKAIKGMVLYPQKTLEYVFRQISTGQKKSQHRAMDLILQAPVNMANQFFNQWLAEPDEEKMDILVEAIRNTGKRDYLNLIADHLRHYRGDALRAVHLLSEAGISVFENQETKTNRGPTNGQNKEITISSPKNYRIQNPDDWSAKDRQASFTKIVEAKYDE